ncbi:MAG TPA: iron ABC transporter permease [Bordetella sp.]|nr:iron ABC transporter permease [Bordetella sp.]
MSVIVSPKYAASPGPRRGLQAGVLTWPLVSIVLTGMVLLPLLWLVVISLQTDDTGAWTLQNYIDAFGSGFSRQAVVNSLILAGAVAAGATVLGTLLAWLVTRTDMPLARTVRALVTASFVTPSFLGALAWILLAGPNAGWINLLWTELTGSDKPLFNIFSLGGAMFIMAIYAVSYPFSLVCSALQQAPSEYENAARTLGAGVIRIMRSIMLPLTMPAILSGFILAFLETIAAFGVPAFILIPARTPVMTIQIFSLFSEFPPRLGVAAAYGMPLLLVTLALILIQRRILHRRSYTLITGKGGTYRRATLGLWRWPALVLALAVPLLSVVLPYTVMVLVSLCRAWGKGPLAPGNLTLHWYHATFIESSATQSALQNSLAYCAAAATLAVAVASLAAYIRSRRLIPGSAALGFLAMAPFAVPGIVLGIGFYAAYAHPPIRLIGTPWILIVAFATQFLPIAYSNGMSMIGALAVDLENAGRILGASRMHVLTRITAPLLGNALLSSWMLIFISAFRELSTAIFLFVGSTAVITTTIFDFSSSGNYEQVCTLGVTMMVIILGVVTLVHQVFGKRRNHLKSTQ